MAKILALDASTEACSVALWLDGDVYEHYELAPRAHTQKLLGMVDALLHEHQLTLSQLDAIAYGRGPGSFTGIRIAAGFAQGLAVACQLPMIAVSTLEALALAAQREGATSPMMTLIDARMGEFYWANWQAGEQRPTLLGAEQVSKPEVVLAQLGASQSLVGNGIELLPKDETDNKQSWPQLVVRAADMVRLAHQDWLEGKAVDPEDALPVYLRDNVTD